MSITCYDELPHVPPGAWAVVVVVVVVIKSALGIICIIVFVSFCFDCQGMVAMKNPSVVLLGGGSRFLVFQASQLVFTTLLGW